MSIKTMSRVWDHSAQKGSSLLLLLAIADHADDRGENAWPSVDTLARKTRMTPRQVQKLIRKLEASGELVVKRSRGGRKRCHLFTVSTPTNGELSRRNGELSDGNGELASSPEPSYVTPIGTVLARARMADSEKWDRGELARQAAKYEAKRWLESHPERPRSPRTN